MDIYSGMALPSVLLEFDSVKQGSIRYAGLCLCVCVYIYRYGKVGKLAENGAHACACVLR